MGIHEIKNHFLAFRRQAVNFVQKQDTPVRFLHKPFFFRIGPGKCSFDMSKDMGQQQLGIVVIIRTVEHDKG
ncbi:hypothetical protein D3C86_2132140 [compost metagenome]